MKLLFLIAMSAYSESLPLEKIDKEDSVQAIQQALDDRFSVRGGTVSGSVYVSTMIYVNTSPVVTAASSTTYTGNNIYIGTSTFSGPVQGPLRTSTRTFIAANTTAISESILGVAVANSTITLTTNVTARHELVVNAIMRVSDSGARAKCGILQNGALFDGQTSTIGIWTGHSQGAPHYIQFATTWRTQNTYAAGTYNYTIACAVSAGNVQFCSNSDANIAGVCFFEAGEYK